MKISPAKFHTPVGVRDAHVGAEVGGVPDISNIPAAVGVGVNTLKV